MLGVKAIATRKHRQSYRHADTTASGSTVAYRCMEYQTWSLSTVRPWRFS